MCLAVPSKIVSIDETGTALVSVMGVERSCSLRLTPDAQVGDYVLVHAGFAIQRVEEQDARETLRLLAELPDLLGDEFAGELASAADSDAAQGRENPVPAAAHAE